MVYSIGKFAKKIGVCVQTLRNWDKSGKLKPAYKVSGRRSYSEEQLNEILHPKEAIDEKVNTREEYNTEEEVLEAVKSLGATELRFASDELRSNKRMILKAVKLTGLSLNFASDELKNDKKVVMEAVKQDGIALVFASDELRDDDEVVEEAIKQERYAMEFASKRIKAKLGWKGRR